MTRIVFQIYLARVALTLVLALLAVFILNALIDPLWYFRGNVITKHNFAFNERFSKAIRFLKHPGIYDCLVLGSSRATLLNASSIDDHHCYNFAFSGGGVSEFLSYARYLKNRGFQPKKLIISVDGFNFFSNPSQPAVPEFVQKYEDPPGVLKSYLTLGALAFSCRSLLGDSPFPRYYKPDFSTDILEHTEHYEPRRPGLPGEAPYRWELKYNANITSIYQQLFSVFPDAEVVAYVPPISVWRVARYEHEGALDYYLAGVHSVARLGVRLFDFSVPSDITFDKARTYDGSHYNPATNQLVARRMNGADETFGLRVDTLSLNQYREIFRTAFGGYWHQL